MQNNDMSPIRYQITPSDPYAHLFTVRLQISTPAPEGQQLRLPAWIPGSYMIRDFAKNVVTLRANCGAEPVKASKLDKDTWQLEPCAGPLDVEYQVYAWDMSVRSAHLDQTHAYFNGTSVFLEVVGQSDSPCDVDIRNADIPEASHWRVATSLKRIDGEEYAFGWHRADNYRDLIDHPVEIADFALVRFKACGVPHDFVVTGLHNADMDRIAEDLTRICEHQIRLFGEPAPFERYVFITWAVGNGYGGLEHCASTSLICNRDDLPCRKERGRVSEGYKTFLGLCSHEYFHSWNVKRIQPDIPYDLSRENHTPLLWAFEGITSYYDDLTLARTGLISNTEYLELLAKNLTRLLRNPGRFKQSAAESSFDAWTKFYKQDENAGNAIVSYYSKGAVIALGLDLLMRRISDNETNLDQVMQCLWQQNGQVSKPVAEFDIQDQCLALSEACGATAEGLKALTDFFQQVIYGVDDPDFSAWFEPFGIQFNVRQANSMGDAGGNSKLADDHRADLGIMVSHEASGSRILRVWEGSCAQRSGLSAGDLLIALDHIRLESGNLEKLLNRYQPGDSILLHAFRRDELMSFKVELQAPQEDTVFLTVEDKDKLKRWLAAGQSDG